MVYRRRCAGVGPNPAEPGWEFEQSEGGVGLRTLLVNPTIDRELELFHLGTAGIASYVNALGRHQAEVIDFTFHWDTWEQTLRDRLIRFRPQVLGISTVTPRMPSIRRIAQAAKRFDPSITVVLGGHHASLDTSGTVSLPEVDFALIGEGELTFHALLDALEDGRGVEDIPSLAWSEDGTYRENPLGPLPKGAVLDAFPPMDWSLWEQLPRMLFHSGFVPIIGVRGCPYKCSFCSSPVLAKRLSDAGPFVRKRDATMVAEEGRYQWERHRHQGLRYLNFYDQNFLMNTNWLEEFTAAYRSLGMHEKLPFSAYSRVDHITEERLDLARQAGCIQLRLGIEAGDQFVRNTLLNKELDQDVLESKLEMIRDSGIKTLGYFMIGTPGETLKQANRSWTMAASKWAGPRRILLLHSPLESSDHEGRRNLGRLPRARQERHAVPGRRTHRGEQQRLVAPTQTALLRHERVVHGEDHRPADPRSGNPVDDRFPAYYRESRNDGMDLKLILSQYVYFHGDSFFEGAATNVSTDEDTRTPVARSVDDTRAPTGPTIAPTPSASSAPVPVALLAPRSARRGDRVDQNAG